jgi:hypothetical protein
MTRVMYAQYIYLIGFGSVHYFNFHKETRWYCSLDSKESSEIGEKGVTPQVFIKDKYVF